MFQIIQNILISDKDNQSNYKMQFLNVDFIREKYFPNLPAPVCKSNCPQYLITCRTTLGSKNCNKLFSSGKDFKSCGSIEKKAYNVS